MRATNQHTTSSPKYIPSNDTAQEIALAAGTGDDELLAGVLSADTPVQNDVVKVGLAKQEKHAKTQSQAKQASHTQANRGGVGYQRTKSTPRAKAKSAASSTHKASSKKPASSGISTKLGKFFGLLKSLGYTKGGKLSDVGVEKLKRHIVAEAKPPLTDAQQMQLEKGLTLLADVLPKSSHTGKELENLIGLVRGGQVEKLGALSSLSEVRVSQQAALAAMVSKPEKADQIVALTQQADFKALILKGNAGLGTQKALLVAMGMGKDGAALLAQDAFKKLPPESQLMMARRLYQVPEFQAKDFPKFQKSLKAVYQCLSDYKDFSTHGAANKQTAARKLAGHIRLYPYMLKMMTPSGRMSVARALLEQLGTSSPSKGITDISEALASIKSHDPTLYKNTFGAAGQAILKGSEGWKNLWEQLKSKRSDAVATVVSAVSTNSLGVLAGVIDGARMGKSTGEKLFNAYTNGVVGVLGTAVAGASTIASFGVGLGPGAITALWSHYCDSVVGAQNRTNLQGWLKQPNLAP